MLMNHSMAENFMRSANAPQIRAGVMMAKVSWNIEYTTSGIVGARCETVVVFGSAREMAPFMNMRENPPRYGVLPGVNAQEYPTTHHSIVTRQVIAKLCISVASTFFLRTMPP